MSRKEKLLKAIDLAQGPGKCLYVVDGKPCCVVGQLAILEGVAIDFFEQRNKMGCRYNELSIGPFTELTSELDYNECMLQKLQSIWDGAGEEDVEKYKQQMRDVVNEYFPG